MPAEGRRQVHVFAAAAHHDPPGEKLSVQNAARGADGRVRVEQMLNRCNLRGVEPVLAWLPVGTQPERRTDEIPGRHLLRDTAAVAAQTHARGHGGVKGLLVERNNDAMLC